MEGLPLKTEKLKNLSERQREILRYVCEGQSYVEIAALAHVEERTVQFHMSNIYVKLGIAHLPRALRQRELGSFCPALSSLVEDTLAPRVSFPLSKSRRRLHIFLCHSSADKPAVRNLYQRLRSEGFEPWLDEEDLMPGQDWDYEIRRAVRASDVVVVCMSRGSVTKAGYVQKEIKYVLDVADAQPEGTIFLIPLRLEACEVPERLSRRHWVDLFEERGYERLKRALLARADALGIIRP